MKRRLYLIILLAALVLSGMAQTVGESMYIYRSNGQINGFLPDEIESIDYSYTDEEGNVYEEIVTQIVNTADSIYYIPIAEIDSISFVTPKTVYQPGVINISEQLMSYVENCNDLTITFNSSTPNSMMPRVGDKLVTLDMNEKFPAGFAGEVVAINGYQVECKLVSLGDIFESYHGVSSIYGYQDNNNSRSFSLRRSVNSFGNKDFKLRTFTWSVGEEEGVKLFGSESLALKGGTKISIGITPSFHIISTLIIGKEEGINFSSCIVGDMTVQESASIYGGLELSKDFLDKEIIKCPVAPMVFFYFKPGCFVRGSVMISASYIWTQQYKLGLSFDYSSNKQNIIKPSCVGRLMDSSSDLEGALEGSIAVGSFIEMGLTLCSSDIDKLCFRGELGAELVGDAVLYNSEIKAATQETKIYEKFKNSKIEYNVFYSSALQIEIGPLDYSLTLPWNLNYNIKTWDVVPTFSNTKFKQELNPLTSAEGSVDIDGNCVFPVDVTMKVFDKKGNFIARSPSSQSFKKGNANFSDIISGLKAPGDYTVYPVVSLFGYEMLASPYSDMEKVGFAVATDGVDKITDNSATLNAHLNVIGGEMPGYVCFYYGTDNNPQKNGTLAYVCDAKNLAGNNFSIDLSRLQPRTSYYYVAAYNNGEDIIFGEVKSFKTKDQIVVTTGGATNITTNSATLNGYYESNLSSVEYGFIYGTSSSINYNSGMVMIANNSNNGDFSLTLVGLSSETTYYYRAYAKEKDIVYGEIKSFKTNDNSHQHEVSHCPDNNHPHVIDLGLPSGTKWACCNVGASKPEDYGGYFAWGETEEKTVYDVDSYSDSACQYCMTNKIYDIAGTIWDVATVLWGGGWQLPNNTQFEELVNNTSFAWTTRKGVNGIELTGYNGGTIFLPASGAASMDPGQRGGIGEQGNYLSSSLEEGWIGSAGGLFFYSKQVMATWHDIVVGLSARPIHVN